MSGPIEFWFDFSSPYAYFAAGEIERRMAPFGRTVDWRPFLLGAVFRMSGMQALAHTPLRGDYARRDWNRLAEITGMPFRLPAEHPYASQAVARAFYWFRDNRPDAAVPFARRAFAAHFVEQRSPASVESALALAEGLCPDADALAGWLRADEAKRRLRAATAEALSKGVFGAPFFIADGEPFWGWDRIPMLERRLNGTKVRSL